MINTQKKNARKLTVRTRYFSRGVTLRSFSRMVWSLCCRSLFSDITSSFSWLMRMKLSVPPESIDWVMELLLGERKELEASRINVTLCAFHNNHNTYCTCPRWMASSPVLVSSLESPSGLKTIYGYKENQNGIVQFVPKSFLNVH